MSPQRPGAQRPGAQRPGAQRSGPRRPGPSSRRAAGRRPFGATWWGAAWVAALEGRARLDPNRLPRGRTYARSGAVGPLELAPGEIRAPVQGSRARPYQVRVRVRRFERAELERLLDTLAAQIGHAAALLDGEIPAEVAADAAGAGADLLPGPGEVQTRCSCPDWAEPCKHAAAVCYLVADALDEDPFGVFLLRGVPREALLAGLRARRREGAAEGPPPVAEGEDPGVRAAAAWRDAARREIASTPLPAGLAQVPPRRPGLPTVLAADPPAGLGVDPSALRSLAADAAERALGLLRGGTTSGIDLTEDEDLARRAERMVGAEPAGGPGLAALARRSGRRTRELLAMALAYRYGGPDGLAAWQGAADPDPAALAACLADLGPGAVARRGRVTVGDRQLRAGPDGRWYPMRRDRSGGWLPDGPPLDRGRPEPGDPGGAGDDDGGVGAFDDGGVASG